MSRGMWWPGVARLPENQRGLSATGGAATAAALAWAWLLLLWELQPSGGRSEPHGDGDWEGDGSDTPLRPNTEEAVSSS